MTPYYAAVAVLVQMYRTESRKYFGAEPKVIGVPFTKQQIDWLFQNDDNWAIAFANFMGDIDNHYPSNKLLQFANLHALVFPKIVRSSPLPNSETVFTDGSSNGTVVYVITGQKTIFHTPAASAQVVELRAVASVFDIMKDKRFNLYTDSKYIAEALPLLETVACIDTANKQVLDLFGQIQSSIQQRTEPCFVGHIRAHSDLPGPLAEGNNLADEATQLITVSQVEQAQKSHALHHQNSRSLHKQFHITREAARQIVKQCPMCPQHQTVPHYGVNPRGLKPNQ